jgi:hypothetical protein
MTIRIARSADGYRPRLGGPDGDSWTSIGPIGPTEVLQELSRRGCSADEITAALRAADLEWGRNGGAGAPSWSDLHLQEIIRDRPVDGVTPVTPGWRFASIGFENDPTDVGGGINPWLVTWLSLYRRVVVAHPQYPHQRHDLETYQVAGTDPPVVFAAGEFSNGVWGFHVPLTTPSDIRPRRVASTQEEDRREA